MSATPNLVAIAILVGGLAVPVAVVTWVKKPLGFLGLTAFAGLGVLIDVMSEHHGFDMSAYSLVLIGLLAGVAGGKLRELSAKVDILEQQLAEQRPQKVQP